jgi:trimeric autotransporter adhesin
MARVIHSASEAARTTVASTTYIDKVVLNFTPDENSDYCFLWSVLVDIAGTAQQVQVRLRHDTAAVDLAVQAKRVKDTTDVVSAGGVAFATFGTSPGSQTFSIEFSSSTTITSGAQQAYLTAFKLTANDKKVGVATTNTTSSTPVAAATLSWTPSSTGDYVIIASAGLASASATTTSIRLTDGTTTYGLCDPISKSSFASAIHPWAHAVYAPGLSGAQDWSVTCDSDGSLTLTITDVYIVALRVSDWPAFYQTADRARTTTTSTTYVTRSTLTQTTATGDHVQLAVSVVDMSSTSSSALWRMTLDGVAPGESLREPAVTSAQSIPEWRSTDGSLTAASHTWLTQYAAENNTAGIASSAIIVLQAEDVSGVVTGTASGTLTAATASATGTFTPQAVTGTATATLAVATAAASGTFIPQAITGTAAATLAAATANAAGELTITGAGVGTLAAATAAATGNSTSGLSTVEIGAIEWGAFIIGELEFTGTAAATLSAITASGSGWAQVTGTASATLQAATGSASGTLTLPGVSGDGDAVLQAATAAATGSFTAPAVTGTAAATLASVTASAIGQLTIAGTAAGNLQAATAAATGLLEPKGTAAGTLAAATAAATAQLTISGSAAGVLAVVTGDATGTFFEGISGVADAQLQPVTGVASGLVDVRGDAEGVLAAATASASGVFTIAEVTGTGDADLAAATASASGALTISGTAAASLRAATAAATGNVVPFQGAAAGLLAAATGSATGAITVFGTAAGQLEASTADAVGWVQVTGAGAGVLAVAVASAIGVNSTGIPVPDSRVIKVAAREGIIVSARGEFVHVPTRGTLAVGTSRRVIKVPRRAA